MAPSGDSGAPEEDPPTGGRPVGDDWSVGHIGYRFDDPGLLDQAMAHRSWCAERPERTSNERLEFLGDAVLGLIVAEYAYRSFPDRDKTGSCGMTSDCFGAKG